MYSSPSKFHLCPTPAPTFLLADGEEVVAAISRPVVLKHTTISAVVLKHTTISAVVLKHTTISAVVLKHTTSQDVSSHFLLAILSHSLMLNHYIDAAQYLFHIKV